MRRQVARLGLLVLLAAATVSGQALQEHIEAPEGMVDHPAPLFSRLDLDGSKIDLAAYRGRVVLLNFWATWCGPCRVELPIFAGWQAKYQPRGFQVLAISMDDSERLTRSLVQKERLSIPVIMGDPELGKLYGGILGLPVTFLIDRAGKVRFCMEGETKPELLRSRIEDLLSEPAVP